MENLATESNQGNDPLDDLVDSIIEDDNPDGHIPENQEPSRRAEEPREPLSQETQPADELEPPQHWSEEHKATFREQSPEARKFLLDRHRQMEGDYTQKTQQLAQQAQAVAGLQGLGARLQQDPNFRVHMQNYFQQQVAQPQGTEKPAEKEVDPIDEIENRAAEKAYARIKNEQEVAAKRAQAHDFERAWNMAENAKARDPLNQKVMAKLKGYVNAQKHPIRINETLQQLDSNPFFFNEMYRVMREEVLAEELQPGETVDEPTAQQHQTRRTVAPTLERGGGAPIQTSQSKIRKRRSEMKNEALRSGTTEALGEFLDSTGLIDSLL
jgi:hypothetical protein